jgi:cytochrome bd-type quinol oxidase subunit 1
MTDLFAARSQMAISLGFHSIFAAIGFAMPFFMAISHWRWAQKQRPGLPGLHQDLVLHIYIPLSLMLIGIVLRLRVYFSPLRRGARRPQRY